MGSASFPDILCFSHLRWQFVFQRPQHLMTRFARTAQVLYVEEPLYDATAPHLTCESIDGVRVVTPHLPVGSSDVASSLLRTLVDQLLSMHRLDRFMTWYYTPMALPSTRHLRPMLGVYDCMDELANFLAAPAEITVLERELFERVDLVFAGGPSLYELKRRSHPRVYEFPSSVDVEHFASARGRAEPADQAGIPKPRVGFFGVIDERMDIALLGNIAAARPDLHFVLIGPVVKVDAATLPRRANLHYLGPRPYAELPGYVSGWQVGMLPFARNDATRYISPTKIPEYLAAGIPVVSTSIPDVASRFGASGLAAIADTPDAFLAAVDSALIDNEFQRGKAAAFLRATSWDHTWSQMRRLASELLDQRAARAPRPLTEVTRVRAVSVSPHV